MLLKHAKLLAVLFHIRAVLSSETTALGCKLSPEESCKKANQVTTTSLLIEQIIDPTNYGRDGEDQPGGEHPHVADDAPENKRDAAPE